MLVMTGLFITALLVWLWMAGAFFMAIMGGGMQ